MSPLRYFSLTGSLEVHFTNSSFPLCYHYQVHLPELSLPPAFPYQFISTLFWLPLFNLLLISYFLFILYFIFLHVRMKSISHSVSVSPPILPSPVSLKSPLIVYLSFPFTTRMIKPTNSLSSLIYLIFLLIGSSSFLSYTLPYRLKTSFILQRESSIYLIFY